MCGRLADAAPDSAFGRVVVAVLSASIGVPAAIVTIFGLGSELFLLIPIAVACVTLYVAATYTMSVITDAEQTPDTEQQSETQELDSSTDPIAALRMRYARGELTDQEFEHRLERLLETESNSESERQPDRLGELV